MKQFYQYIERILITLILSALFLSNISGTYADVATVSIPDTLGMPGDTILIPVRINNAAELGVISADITLSFDSNVLTADSASLGNAVPTDTLRIISLIESNPMAGRIIIAIASAYPISKDGDLVTIPFIVAEGAAPGDSCTIHFVECKLNEGKVNSIAEDGLFVVTPTFSISGYVRYYSNDAPIDSTLARLSPQVTKTDINGYYIFSNLVGDHNYTVVIDKTNPTWDEAVTPYDASYAMYYIAGGIDLSKTQQMAADVSGNGSISSYDAALILQYAAQVIDRFPVGDWIFTPKSRSYDFLSSNLAKQNYYGILYGDVSGNWNNPDSKLKGGSITSNDKLSKLLPATTTALVSVPNVTGMPGNSVTVPINIGDASNIVAANIVLAYDTNVLTSKNVSVTSFTSNYLVAYKVSDGQLRIALAGTNPLIGNGALVNIMFDVTNTAYASGNSPLTLTYVELNEGNIPCKVSSGKFTIVTAGITDNARPTPDKVALLGNSPNPFNQRTVISYSIGSCHTACIGGQLPNNGQRKTGNQHVVLEIYDISGRVVKTFHLTCNSTGSDGQSPFNQVAWDGTDNARREVPNGIYFCQLRATNYVDTKKIVLMR